MSVRFVLPSDTTEAVAMTYSPLTELALSLRVLAAPERHPLKHAWVRRMRRLSPDLKRRIRAFRFAYRCGIPDSLFPHEERTGPSFADELRRVAALDPAQIASELEAMLRLDRRLEDGEADGLSETELAEVAAERIGEESPDEAEVIRLVSRDPEAALARFVSLLQDYWQASFSDDWRTIEPLLAAANRELDTRMRTDFFGSVTSLQHQLRGDPRTRSIAVDIRAERTVAAGAETKLVLAPSSFLWPNVMVKFDPPGARGFVYPAPTSAQTGVDFAADIALVKVVKALADDTRLRALKLLSREPRTTQELAPLLRITESGLSKHLRILAEADLVQTRREGYYVVYSVAPARIASLSKALLEFIDAENAGFALRESVAAGESR